MRYVRGMRIVEDDLTGAEIQELLRIHAEGMLANSPEGSCHFLDLSGLQAPHVTVWSLWDDGNLAGCGALSEIDTSHGEVKSMRTAERHLGKGVGRKLLNHVVATAKARGYNRLSLETGNTESFAAAIHLYKTAGFVECDPFADYEATEFNRYFTLSL